MVIRIVTKRIQICLATPRKHGVQVKISPRHNSED